MDNFIDIVANEEKTSQEGANILFWYFWMVIPYFFQHRLISVELLLFLIIVADVQVGAEFNASADRRNFIEDGLEQG